MTVHRATTDRRQFDFGPPGGWVERRCRAERRLPAAEEAELSADEFAKYFGSFGKVVSSNANLFDEAAEILDRVRDGY